MLRHLDLFSGIGGFALGLYWTRKVRTVGFCESDPFCRQVLGKYWFNVPCYPDIQELTYGQLAADGLIPIDLLTAGFPCQDISTAGQGRGLTGPRSGLWFHCLRVVQEVRPRWVLVENVPALRTRGADVVLGGLEEAGYTCRAFVVGAWAVGAPHKRDRVWIVAHAESERSRIQQSQWKNLSDFSPGTCQDRRDSFLAHAERSQWGADNLACGTPGAQLVPQRKESAIRARAGGTDVADADSELPRYANDGTSEVLWHRTSQGIPWSNGQPQSCLGGLADGLPDRLARHRTQWLTEPPDVPRVATGVPQRAAKLRALGNAVVPQLVQVFGEMILAYERRFQ